jgi:hypothetical protein
MPLGRWVLFLILGQHLKRFIQIGKNFHLDTVLRRIKRSQAYSVRVIVNEDLTIMRWQAFINNGPNSHVNKQLLAINPAPVNTRFSVTRSQVVNGFKNIVGEDLKRIERIKRSFTLIKELRC